MFALNTGLATDSRPCTRERQKIHVQQVRGPGGDAWMSVDRGSPLESRQVSPSTWLPGRAWRLACQMEVLAGHNMGKQTNNRH